MMTTVNEKFVMNAPLAPMTTMGVGGAAKCLARVTSTQEMVKALEWAAENRLPVFVLGGGSNVVFADRGFQGMVLQPMLRGIVAKHVGSRLLFQVGAGESWDGFVQYCVRCRMGGVECLSGIPGTVGAAPVQNIGAYGQEVSQVIDSVRVLDRETMTVESHAAAWCGFGYRTSRFKAEPDRYIVTAVTFALQPNAVPELRYADLERWFEEHPLAGPPRTDTVRRAVLEVRSQKGMVYDKDVPATHGCGSFFTNPVLGAREFEHALHTGGYAAEQVPHHAAGGGGDDGAVKVSAAWLIEQAGFARGSRYENTPIALNPHHALAIVNYGRGTARQVVEFMQAIQDAVRTKFGIELAPEPNLVGFKQAGEK